MPGAVLELMGCQRGPADFLDKELRNITVCSHTGNVRILLKVIQLLIKFVILKIRIFFLILAIHKTWLFGHF